GREPSTTSLDAAGLSPAIGPDARFVVAALSGEGAAVASNFASPSLVTGTRATPARAPTTSSVTAACTFLRAASPATILSAAAADSGCFFLKSGVSHTS